MKLLPAFTLIELLVALVILAVLTAAVGLNFAGPMRQQKRSDEIDALCQFDAGARTVAVARGQTERLVFDVSAKTVSRYDGIESRKIAAQLHVPSLLQVRIASMTSSDGPMTVDISAKGMSRSYTAAAGGRFVAVAGLSGEAVVEDHARDLQSSDR